MGLGVDPNFDFMRGFQSAVRIMNFIQVTRTTGYEAQDGIFNTPELHK